MKHLLRNIAWISLTLLGVCACQSEQESSFEDRPTPDMLDDVDLRFLDSRRGAPPPASSYTTFEEAVIHKNPVFFNGQKRKQILGVTVRGVDVVFDPHDARQRLNDYDGLPNLGTLTIFAERVVVRGSLDLPGTTLSIYARELVFEDVPNEETARINTSPHGIDSTEIVQPTHAVNSFKKNIRTPASDGRNGEDAGDVTLVLNALIAPGEHTRIVMRGSNGTHGGEAAKGRAFSVLRTYHGGAIPTHELKKQVRHLHAVPGGKPGDGGSAGALTSTLAEIASCAQRVSGTPGKPTKEAKGGKTSPMASNLKPQYAKDRGLWPMTDGRNAPKRMGALGEVCPFIPHSDTRPFAWAHPEVLDLILERLEDVYLAGYHDRASDICLHALAWVKNVSTQPVMGDYGFASFRARLFTIAQRLTNGLDYFGHPAGWVPLLSFEATYATFRQEARASVRTMVLSHWMERYWERQEDRQTALREVMRAQEERIETARIAIRRTRKLLPTLEREQSSIAKASMRLRQSLASIEARLRDKFKEDKESERMWGAILTGVSEAIGIGVFLPMGDSAGKRRGKAMKRRGMGGVGKTHLALAGVAGVAAGLGDYLANAPANVSGSAGSDAFRNVLDEEEAAEARARLASLDPTTVTDQTVYLDGVLGIAKAIRKATEALLREQMLAVTENAGDVEAESELQARINANGAFRVAFDRLVLLLTQKQIFSEQVARATDAMDSALADIIEATWLIETSQTALRQNSIDRTSRTALRRMRRGAKERLIRYQYYMAKAFEYRVMEPCPVDFQRNRLFERIESMFALEASSDLTKTEVASFGIESPLVDDLADVYQDILSEITEMIVRGMQTNRFTPGDWPYEISLTSNELEQLNKDGRVAIDLPEHGMILPTDRNCRIKEVRVINGEDKTQFTVVAAPTGREANLDITFEPPQQSYILWNDGAFGVDYRRDTNLRIDLWAYTWSAQEGTGHMVPRSRDTASLLRILVPETKNLERIHFRPSAHGTLIVNRETATDVDIRVNKLSLSFVIEKNKTETTK